MSEKIVATVDTNAGLTITRRNAYNYHRVVPMMGQRKNTQMTLPTFLEQWKLCAMEAANVVVNRS